MITPSGSMLLFTGRGNKMKKLLLAILIILVASPAWSATWYAQKAANIDSVSSATTSDVWNAAANGSGAWLDLSADYSADTFRGKAATAVAINVSWTCAQIDSIGNTGTFTIAANVTLTADLVGGSSSTFLINGGTPIVTVNGSVTGGSGTCILISVAGTLIIDGNVTGGSGDSRHGINNTTAAATITVTGDVLGGSNAGAIGINCSSVATVLSITGNVTAAAGKGIVANLPTASVTITGGNIVDSGTQHAVGSAASIIYIPGAANYYRMRTAGAATIDLIYDVPALASILATDTLQNVAGSIATQTPDNSTVSQAAGYYDAFNLATVDTDLAVGNIKAGVTIFGLAGEAASGGGTVGHAF